MEAAEKDRTDLGLIPEITDEELRELRAQTRARRVLEERPEPPALPEQRRLIMEQIRRQLGWARPS